MGVGVLIGMLNSFRMTDSASTFRDLNGWLRRTLRQMVWKRWKSGSIRYRTLVSVGVSRDRAAPGAMGKILWHMARAPVVHDALTKWAWHSTASLVYETDSALCLLFDEPLYGDPHTCAHRRCGVSGRAGGDEL